MANNPNHMANLRNGGTNKGGTGRPAEWLKAKCQDIIDKKQLIEFLGAVASGEPMVEKMVVMATGGKMEKVAGSADIKDRLKAAEMLLDRGWGKAVQVLGDTNLDTFPFVIVRPDERKVA